MNENNEVVFLHLDDIIPNRFQPREVFDEKALKELAVSIKEHGVIQPIIVRKINENKYEIIAGERRYKASALAGLTSIPAIIRNLDDKEAAKVALLENLQRRNLNPIEEARTYQKIIELDEMTQEELAKTMGKSQSAVANKLRLLSLTEEVQKSLLKEEISERHARTLLNLSDSEQQVEMLKKVIKQKMTVRQLENEIKELTMPKDEIKDSKDLNSLINPQPVSLANMVTENNNSSTPPVGGGITPPILPVINKDLPQFPQTSKEEVVTNPNNNQPFLMNKPPVEEPLKKVTPPTFITPQPQNKDEIINYGEIDEEEQEEPEQAPDITGNNSTLLSNPINLMDLKNNTKDITNINDAIEEQPLKEVRNPKSDIDSLLNIKPNLMSIPQNNNEKKLSPAEEALKASENKNYENKEDYFKAPNLMSIELPNSVPLPKENAQDMFSNPSKTNNSLIEFTKRPKEQNKENKTSLTDINQTLFQKPIEKPQVTKPTGKSLGSALLNETLKVNNKTNEEYNIQQMVNEIRKTLKDLEMHGAKIDTDEMNFENQYQILIKIDKNSNY